LTAREKNWESARSEQFDVAIVGGGINGACLYDALCKKGYRTILLDKGDFACGSSQASGMMVWGGLLYLKNFDVASVYKFSRARDKMIDTHQESISPRSFRYVPENSFSRNKLFIHTALYFYWVLGLFNRRKPKIQNKFSESSFLTPKKINCSHVFEEGFLNKSDSRFVLRWITPHKSIGQVALNYCELVDGNYAKDDDCWRLSTKDSLSGKTATIRTKLVINCAGIWTDNINEQFGIKTPYKHIFSKGVYVSTAKNNKHQSPLILDMGNNGDVLTYVPWGPVSMWGPTETKIDDISTGFQVTKDDLDFLLNKYSKKLKYPIDKKDIISFRCGIRPLVVPRSFSKDIYPLELSRTSKITVNKSQKWISIYGGKITGCTDVVKKSTDAIRNIISPSLHGHEISTQVKNDINLTKFPGIEEEVPSVEWCKKYEYCQTLEDYLRRRTNISQWTPREGLGEKNEHLPWIEDAAIRLHDGNIDKACKSVADYQRNVNKRFDSLIDSL